MSESKCEYKCAVISSHLVMLPVVVLQLRMGRAQQVNAVDRRFPWTLEWTTPLTVECLSVTQTIHLLLLFHQQTVLCHQQIWTKEPKGCRQHCCLGSKIIDAFFTMTQAWNHSKWWGTHYLRTFSPDLWKSHGSTLVMARGLNSWTPWSAMTIQPYLALPSPWGVLWKLLRALTQRCIAFSPNKKKK